MAVLSFKECMMGGGRSIIANQEDMKKLCSRVMTKARLAKNTFV